MTGGGNPSVVGVGRALWRAERAALGRQELLSSVPVMGCGRSWAKKKRSWVEEKEKAFHFQNHSNK
jgi:hypothetical protein